MRADRPEVDLLLFDEPVSGVLWLYMRRHELTRPLSDIIAGCACPEQNF